MSDVEDADGHRTKRFKHQSYSQQLKQVHLPSALAQIKPDDEIDETSSHFYTSLTHWLELNLAPSFHQFARKAAPLSQSLVLLLHHWRDVVDLWVDALKKADDEGLRVLLDLLQNLTHDLRLTLIPVYNVLLSCLLPLLTRSISAEALTALLASFSALFKYLLLPTVNATDKSDPEIVASTWDQLLATMKNCSPEVQRAAAETWAFALRRLKPEMRDQCVKIMLQPETLENLEAVEDAVAWIFVFASKSVTQTLHTCTPSLLISLLQCHLASTNCHHGLTEKLLRRTLTALTHHCYKPDQFTAVADLLVDRLENALDSHDPETIRRLLEVISVPCSVRKGSRLTRKHVSRILMAVTRIELLEAMHLPAVKLVTALLVSSESDLALWIGPGRHVIDHAWNSTSCYPLSLTGALADVQWPGLNKFAVPLALKNVVPAGDDGERKMMGLRLLAKLASMGLLDGGDSKWKADIEEWAQQWLRSFELSETSAPTFREIMLLRCAFRPSTFIPGLVKTTQGMLQSQNDPKEYYQKTWANDGWAFGTCLLHLAKFSSDEIAASGLDIRACITTGARKWAWSECAMTGLVALAVSYGKQISDSIPLADIYEALKEMLMSHSQTLRLASLQLLSSPVITSSPACKDVLTRCLAAEQVPLTVQGVRERVLRTSKIAQAVQVGDDNSADICTRWLLGQLKVNLRPLWGPAAEAIGSLAQKTREPVWALILRELRALCRQDPPAMEDFNVRPSWARAEGVGGEGTDDDEVKEEERSWRDPSAFKIRSVVKVWMSSESCKVGIIKEQSTRERLDLHTYEAQLLVALGSYPALPERHSRDLVPVFLSFASPTLDTKPPRTKLTNWLTLFSKFSNPKALHASSIIQALYVSLLSHPDKALQLLSLTCLLTYKSPSLCPYEDKIRGLLDETKWRDELATLEMDKIEVKDRGDLVPVLIRLFFGMMLERKGHGKGTNRRVALLSAMGACDEHELALLVELMVEPFQDLLVEEMAEDGQWNLPLGISTASDKQQLGFLILLEDVLRNLGSRIVSQWPKLLAATLLMTAKAQRKLEGSSEDPPELPDEEAGTEQERPETSGGTLRPLRIIRQLGLKRLADFFRSPIAFDFVPYMPEIYRAIISPRIPTLDVENTQSPSAMLELFSIWTQRPETAVLLVQYDQRTLPKIYDCLVATNVKPAVVSRIFDMIDRLLSISTDNSNVLETVVKPHMSVLLSNLAALVQRTTISGTSATPLGQRQISILSEIAPYLSDGEQAATLLGLFLPLLRKPFKVVSDKIKADMLKIVSNLLPLIPDVADIESSLFHKTYDAFALLFQTLRLRQARLCLIAAFQQLAHLNEDLKVLSGLLASLNAYSTKRVDEPDFDRRLAAFTSLNEQLYQSLSAMQWSPVIYNMLNFIQDENELSIRNNAAFGIKRFIEVVSKDALGDFQTLFLRMVFPGLKRGLRAKHELVRAEILGVIAFGVSLCDNIPSLQEMRILLAGGDEEANFFNNIYHIQVHRRNRALRRFADHCDEGKFRSSTLSEIFLPLVGSFILASQTTDHHLVNEAILTTGRIAKNLCWGAYHVLVQKYLKLSTDKGNAERAYVRTLVAILDNFHFQMDEVLIQGDTSAEGDDDACDVIDRDTTLATNSKTNTRIADAVNDRLLPSLLKHLEQRNEIDDSVRIPIAIGIAKVAQHLPPASRDTKISRLLTVLCQILRSKSQETRDLTRETLCRIIASLGTSYLGNLLREMRQALLRGPQLHVLAFTTHALLVFLTAPERVQSLGNIDECVPDVVHISAEVIFGQSGKDVQAEEFKTKMREVRGSTAKGMDSFAILAKHITPTAMSGLLLPVKAIMQETESAKITQQIDEVLKRIAGGLNSNSQLGPSELLVLCHTLISQNSRFLKEHQKPQQSKRKRKNDDAIVVLKRRITIDSNHYAHNSYRFVCFGLDLFTTAFRRGRFDFQDAKVISRLEPMVSVIGNTLYAREGPVISLGLKAMAGIVKCPLKSIEKSLPVFIRQTLEIVKQAGSTESEVTQTAFKSLATIIRDCQSAQVKEKDLTYLLDILSPDLEEPSRQAPAFALLRAIISRKFVVPEIYDLMDRVSEIMVTSQSTSVQELCRGVLLQFLLDYPQGKGRLKQQMTFLAKNLSYVFESGRRSVMELLNAIISKFHDALIREYADLLFVALVMVVVNDDSSKCREMAAQLIKGLVMRLNIDQRRVILSHAHSWATQKERPALARVSAQVYGLVIDALQADAKPYLAVILEDINVKLESSAEESEAPDQVSGTAGDDPEWQIPHQALSVVSKVFTIFPDTILQHNNVAWPSVVKLLLYPHAWVRTAACRLLGSLFSVTPIQAPDQLLRQDLPLSLAGMKDVTKSLCAQLKSEHLDDALSRQIVNNLFYIGKCFCAIPVVGSEKSEQASGDEDTDDEDLHSEEVLEGAPVSAKSDPLPWLFSRLSYQARSSHIARRNKHAHRENWTYQPSSIFKWFAAMTSHMSPTQVERYLPHILSPVYRIAEDDTIRDPQMDELKTLAVELQDLVQSKVGTTKFADVYNRIRQSVLGVRRERRTARAVQTTTNPQAAAKRKLQHNIVKKESRKRKNRDFSETKIRSTFAKRKRQDQ